MIIHARVCVCARVRGRDRERAGARALTRWTHALGQSSCLLQTGPVVQTVHRLAASRAQDGCHGSALPLALQDVELAALACPQHGAHAPV